MTGRAPQGPGNAATRHVQVRPGHAGFRRLGVVKDELQQWPGRVTSGTGSTNRGALATL
jgi:hypothetical protein